MTDQQSNINELVDAWQTYCNTIEHWQDEIRGIEPRATGCGPVYELDNKLGRPNESYAIADMRTIPYATPHYHANGETEIYFVLEGSGAVVIGNEQTQVEKGMAVVIPPDTAHFTIPNKNAGLVLAVVNTPPFDPHNAVDLTKTNMDVGFDLELFRRLTADN